MKYYFWISVGFIVSSLFVSLPIFLGMSFFYGLLYNPYIPLVIAAWFEYHFGLIDTFVPWYLLSCGLLMIGIELIRPYINLQRV